VDFPFTSDGCSGGHSARWRFFFGSFPPWQSCCLEHDRPYWKGGTRAQRRLADARLMACVARGGHPVWAIVLWASVRIGGHPLLPFSWRWGYGWKYPRRYERKAT
jgi:hypothetical protein